MKLKAITSIYLPTKTNLASKLIKNFKSYNGYYSCAMKHKKNCGDDYELLFLYSIYKYDLKIRCYGFVDYAIFRKKDNGEFQYKLIERDANSKIIAESYDLREINEYLQSFDNEFLTKVSEVLV